MFHRASTRQRLFFGLLLGLTTLWGVWGASPAQARVEESLSYTKLQGYRAALRYLRVDHGYEVLEKDPDSGYLLFQYPVRDREPTPGSIEIIERDQGVALVVQLPQLPSYHERHLIQGLLKKLRNDYGEPPQRDPPAPEKPDEAPPEDEKDPPTQPGSPPPQDRNQPTR